MYRNQFRPDRFSDHSTTVRRPGRSTHHWVVSGGRGSAAPAARPRSPPNRSGRSGNVQQYRPRSPAGAVPQRNATTYAPVASATDARKESANQGSLESQKTLDVADQSDDLNLQSAEGVSAADFPTPTMHSKGYSSTEFTLQFGSLNPGVINNQCTARATSAPPDMDEKKHDKAHHGLLSDKTNLVSLKPAQEQQNHAATNDLRIDSQSDLIDKYDIVPSTVPSIAAALNSVPQADKVCTDSCKELPRSPSSPTQQHWQRQDVRKDVINATQSDTIQKYPATKPKISVQIPAYTPNVAPPAFVLPLHGRPMPISFQQKQSQVPVEFRGPGVQVQSISSLSGSLPANMAVPMGSAPHMPQFFVHGPQPRALQQQAFIHQGQGLGCAPPASRHLPKLGNMRITTELSQQQPRSCDEQKRPIKITHPDTHKELRLDRRGHLSGQIHVQNMNHRAQPVSTFTPHHNMYYPLQPSIYNTGSIYAPHTNTIPLTTRPICPKVQPTRHSFDPANSYASIKPPMRNPWFNASHKPPNILQAAPDLSSFNGSLPSAFSALGQGTVKSPTVFFPEKNEVLSQTSSPTCMEETPTLLSYSGESALSNQQKMHKLDLEISPEPKKEAYEGNLKLAAGTPGIICNTSPQAVPTQKTHTGPSFVGHAASVVGPPSISVYNSTSVCIASSTSSVTAKPVDIEESPMPAATLLSDAKGKLSHIVPLQSETFPDTEASTKTDNVISTLSSIGSDNADGTSLDSKNLKYDGKSILGKPPLTYKQETLLPKFSASSACNEGLYAKVNPVSFPEKNYEVDCSVTSVPLQIQDMTCSKSKEEQVDLTTMNGLVSASENGTDVGQSVRCQACPESGNPHLSVSIDDFPPSNRNRRTSSGARIGTRESENKLNETIVESARILKNTAPVSSSRVSYQCSAASASMTQTKKSIMESTKAKTTHGRRKRRKDILSKADLYNESSSLDENFESFNTQELVQSSSIVEVNEDCTPNARKGTWTGANDNHNNLLDWEDATEFSTENLGVHGCKNSKNGARANKDTYEYDQKKKYSRDFLLTFAQSCVDLPKCFNAGFDGLDAVIKVNNELHPNHGRIKDRASATSQVNRHAASSKFDEDNWRKSYPSLVSGRGSSRSHSQNQSTNHYTGEILCKAMKEVASQRSTSRGSVDERWQHRTSVKGISSPSQVPIMHRAEKKYEIGKVSDEEEAKQRQLKAILNKLTPQNFEKLFEQVKDLNIDNIVTLAGVISQIFDKALMEPTFCEMYASFCFSLAGELPNFVKDEEKITFKRLLLNKCQEEFERGEREQAEANKAEEEGGMKQSEGGREEKRLRARRRMLGNIRLIGELYKKKMLTERIMHECIKKLLGEYQHPDEEDLEALCKLMSTIGEMIDHSRAKVHMDFYFHIIQKLSANSKLSSRIRFMLEDVIDLRNNKWRQRRKVEGPKKIEEVRRDAVKQKMSQSTRLGSSPNYNSPVTGISSASRPGPPPDNGIRGYSAFASRGSSQVRAYGSQNGNMDTRYQHSNRALLIPLQQRRADNSIRLGPQGDLGKEMSLCGKPAISDDTLLEVPLNIHHGQTSQKSTQNSSTEAASNRTKFQAGTNTAKKQSWGTADHALSILVTAVDPVSQMHTPSMVIKDMCCEVGTFPDEVLQVKAISTIKEFYSAKDEKEVGLCMKEMNAPSFYPSLVSLWINDSFERKDLERELLAKLLVNLCKSQESLLSHRELLQGFQHVLSTLEDAVTDAPKATEFLGRLFAQVILEDVISLKEIGGLLQEGREEPERPASEQRLASEVLGSMLESIRVEKGDSAVEEICAKSKLHWENLRRAGLCI